MYPTDLNESQLELLQTYLVTPLPDKAGRGRPTKQEFRREVNAILYVVKTGCQWRMLPKEFPPWQSVYGYFRRWRLDGTWDRVMHALREQARSQAGRKADPTVAIVDSRSVKTASKGGNAVSMRARRSKGVNSTLR